VILLGVNLIIAGVGGQGSILLSRIIADAVIAGGRQTERVRVGETFGAAMRGGAVSSHVRIGEVEGPLVPRGACDLIIGLEPLETLRIGAEYLARGGTVVMNTKPIPPTEVKVGMAKYPSTESIARALEAIGGRVLVVDGDRLAAIAGSPRSTNVVMLGAAFATGALPVDEHCLLEAIRSRVPPRTVDANLQAFKLGREAVGS